MSLFDLYRSAAAAAAECYVCAAREGRQADGDRCDDCTARLCAVAYSQAVPLWAADGTDLNPAYFDLFANSVPVDGGSATPTGRDLQGWAA